jgi:GT2 family glycosyltransferase
MKYPLVSIITVSYNHPDVTVELLKSLQGITYPNIEIIVVDNASQESTDLITGTFPDIIFIQNTKNLGFAGGNNAGVYRAKGKYALFINNDTEVLPDFLEPLVLKCEGNSRIGAVSPKIKFFYQPNTIQFSGQAPINSYTMRSFGYGYGAIDKGQFDTDALTNFVHGAALMVPMAVIKEVGLMPDCYFLYYEELDWCTKIRKAGYELWYIHNSTILHKESISTGKMTPFKTYYMNRSRILYMRRNLTGVTFFVALLFQIFIAIPKNIFVFLFNKDIGHLKAYIKAINWHISHLFSQEIHTNPKLK